MAQRRRGKGTRWASPEALTEAMAGMKPEHQRCRVFRHAMDIKPNSYRYGVTGTVVLTLTCTRCGAYEKDIEYDQNGGAVLERHSAKYSDDYLLDNVGRIGSDVQGLLFEEVAQRQLRDEIAKPPRKSRKGDVK